MPVSPLCLCPCVLPPPACEQQEPTMDELLRGRMSAPHPALYGVLTDTI